MHSVFFKRLADTSMERPPAQINVQRLPKFGYLKNVSLAPWKKRYFKGIFRHIDVFIKGDGLWQCLPIKYRIGRL